MSRVVWKYPLAPAVTLTMPIGARVVAVGRDPNGNPSLWAEVNELAPYRRSDAHEQRGRHFVVLGTGWPLPDEPVEYVGTVFATDLYPQIWHVYEFVS